MRRLALASLLLQLPLAAAQEVRNLTLTVEKVGEASSPLSTLLALLLVISLGAIAYLVAWLFRRRKARPVKAKVEQRTYEEQKPGSFAMEHIIIEDEVEKHLKEEERIIVRILRQRGGQCEQGTLCIVSGFSKATLSRLLVELEIRGIVKKERQGKKNVVFLRI